MDRWSWLEQNSAPSRSLAIFTVGGVTIYDGDVKTDFLEGELRIYDKMIAWAKDDRLLSLATSLIVLAEDHVEGSFLSKKYYIALHLLPSPPDKPAGPVNYSQFHQVKLRFRAQQACNMSLNVLKKIAAQPVPTVTPVNSAPVLNNVSATAAPLNLRGGLHRIEQDSQKKDAAVSRDIADAFQDFQKLMSRANEMVDIAKSISEKAKKQNQSDFAAAPGDSLTAKELTEFRADMMALGVSSSKNDFSSETNFHVQLAAEMCRLLEPFIRKTGGGLISLTDAYCRFNRARGLDLVSPDDVMAAAKLMEKQNMPLRLHQFSTGVRCLRLADVDSRKLSIDTMNMVKSQPKGCTIDSFSILSSISMAVSRERLFAAESEGYLCRDETAAGLCFYPNRFIHDDAVVVNF